MPAATPSLLLVRHGESTWNAAGRWQGQADPPLTSRGVAQARAGAPAVPGEPAAVVASDLARARVTAEILAAALGLEVDLDPRLRERHGGPWQGKTREEIEAGWPGMLAGDGRPEGYEHDGPLLARALAALDDIAPPAVVVTHGGVIRAVARHLGLALTRIPNLSALVLERHDATLRAGTHVELVADASVATEAGA